LPIIPGHFTHYEWIALAIWASLGFLAHLSVRMRHVKSSDFPLDTRDASQ